MYGKMAQSKKQLPSLPRACGPVKKKLLIKLHNPYPLYYKILLKYIENNNLHLEHTVNEYP